MLGAAAARGALSQQHLSALRCSFVQWLVDEGSLLAQHCAANQDNPWFRMKDRLRRPVHTVALISTTWLFERLCSWRYMQQLQPLSEQEQQGSVGEADSAISEAPAAAASATPVLEAAWYAMPSGERKSFTLFIRYEMAGPSCRYRLGTCILCAGVQIYCYLACRSLCSFQMFS